VPELIEQHRDFGRRCRRNAAATFGTSLPGVMDLLLLSQFLPRRSPSPECEQRTRGDRHEFSITLVVLDSDCDLLARQWPHVADLRDEHDVVSPVIRSVTPQRDDSIVVRKVRQQVRLCGDNLPTRVRYLAPHGRSRGVDQELASSSEHRRRAQCRGRDHPPTVKQHAAHGAANGRIRTRRQSQSTVIGASCSVRPESIASTVGLPPN